MKHDENDADHQDLNLLLQHAGLEPHLIINNTPIGYDVSAAKNRITLAHVLGIPESQIPADGILTVEYPALENPKAVPDWDTAQPVDPRYSSKFYFSPMLNVKDYKLGSNLSNEFGGYIISTDFSITYYSPTYNAYIKMWTPTGNSLLIVPSHRGTLYFKADTPRPNQRQTYTDDFLRAVVRFMREHNSDE